MLSCNAASGKVILVRIMDITRLLIEVVSYLLLVSRGIRNF